MSVIDNLIRLHRWQLEERQRYLADLESLAERLRADAQRLEREISEESRASSMPLDGSSDGPYPMFVRPLIERRRKIERSIAEIEAQLGEARDAVTQAQQEVRLYEMTWEQRGTLPPGQRLTRRSRRSLQAQQATRLSGDRKHVG